MGGFAFTFFGGGVHEQQVIMTIISGIIRIIFDLFIDTLLSLYLFNYGFKFVVRNIRLSEHLL